MENIVPESDGLKTGPNKWLARIESSVKFREKEDGEKGWRRFLEMYQGVYPSIGSNSARRVIPINLVFSYVHTEIPRLYFRDPFISVNAMGQGFIDRAKILEVAVNYLLRELNFKHEIFKVLLDTLLVGHGWLKFGYSGTFGQTQTAETLRFLP